MDFEVMLASIGQAEQAITLLQIPKKTLLDGYAQKCCCIVMGLIRTKPTKPEQKQKKTENLKNELKALRKLDLKEEAVLPKSILDAAIKQISSLC